MAKKELRLAATLLAFSLPRIAESSGLQPQISPSPVNGQAVIARKRSDENISHLAPGPGSQARLAGGANAARRIDVTAAVYDSTGNVPATKGVHVTLVAFDFDPISREAIALDTVDGYTDPSGEFTARLNIGTCRGGGRVGPVRLHRISNRPRYWDITYIPSAYVMAVLDDGMPQRPGNFQHVCNEVYRGNRP